MGFYSVYFHLQYCYKHSHPPVAICSHIIAFAVISNFNNSYPWAESNGQLLEHNE